MVYHDDPNVTIEDKLRMSVCITVPAETKVEGEVGKMEIEAAKYVMARFELTAQDFQQAWDWGYGPSGFRQAATNLMINLVLKCTRKNLQMENSLLIFVSL